MRKTAQNRCFLTYFLKIIALKISLKLWKIIAIKKCNSTSTSPFIAKFAWFSCIFATFWSDKRAANFNKLSWKITSSKLSWKITSSKLSWKITSSKLLKVSHLLPLYCKFAWKNDTKCPVFELFWASRWAILAWNMSCFILKLAYIWWFQVGWGSLFLKIIEHIFKSRLVWGRVLVEDIFNLHLILVEDIFKESSDQTCNKYFFYKRSANFNRIKNCYCLIDEGVIINLCWKCFWCSWKCFWCDEVGGIAFLWVWGTSKARPR